MSIVLLENQTSNGDGSVASWRGGKGQITFSGTFDGATVTLKCRFDSSDDFNAIDGAVFYNANSVSFDMVTGMQLRATVSSAGASTDITMRIS